MKILFITATRIGDAILQSGLLDYMAREYPGAQVTVACGKLCASLYEGFPNVERVIPMVKQKHHGHWIDLWQQVFPTKWDLVVDLRDSAVSRLVRAKKRHVFGKHIDKSKHKVEQAAQVMGLAEVPAPKLYFSAEQNKFADELLPPLSPRKRGEDSKGQGGDFIIAVGPAANWIGKTWPAERFIAVINWLTGPEGLFPNAHVAVFAAPGEEAQAFPVLQSIPAERRIDGIAKGNPGQAAAAIARCDFYLGNDSGLMHAAAASNVPTVGVFGPSYPHWYAPWGDHTAYARTPESFDELTDFAGYDPKTLERTLMTSLSVEVVKKVVTDFFKNREAA